MKRFVVSPIVLGIVLLPSVAAAQSISLTAQQPSYTETFDSLPTNVAVSPWQNGDQMAPTLAGWYAEMESLALGSFDLVVGPAAAGALYNFGSNNASDRALGSQASGTTNDIAYGVHLVNATGGPIDGFTVTYTGEQWRTAGGGVQNVATFHYRVGGATFDLRSQPNGWTPHPAGDFVAIQFGAGGALDGNLTANRTAISTTVSVTIGAGASFWVGWFDNNDTGTDQGLGVDDFTITAIAGGGGTGGGGVGGGGVGGGGGTGGTMGAGGTMGTGGTMGSGGAGAGGSGAGGMGGAPTTATTGTGGAAAGGMGAGAGTTGATTSGTTGGGATTGGGVVPPTTEDEGGCNCRAAGRASDDGSPWFALLGAAWLVRRRRLDVE